MLKSRNLEGYLQIANQALSVISECYLKMGVAGRSGK